WRTQGPRPLLCRGWEGRGIADSFGERLRSYRETATLTRQELAKRAGLTATAISALERGERRRLYPNTVRVLADALGLDSEAQRASFDAIVPRRAVPTGCNEIAVRAAPLLEPTPLLGRDEEQARFRNQRIERRIQGRARPAHGG